MMEILTVVVERCELEPGSHIARKIVSVLGSERIELPKGECEEKRPDWGEYRPLVTFPAIERALRRRRRLGYLPQSETWRFHIVKNKPANMPE